MKQTICCFFQSKRIWSFLVYVVTLWGLSLHCASIASNRAMLGVGVWILLLLLALPLYFFLLGSGEPSWLYLCWTWLIYIVTVCFTYIGMCIRYGRNDWNGLKVYFSILVLSIFFLLITLLTLCSILWKRYHE